MKRMIVTITILMFAIIIIPSLLVIPNAWKQTEAQKSEPKVHVEVVASPIDVPVYRSEKEQVEKIPLEEYVAGVLSSEMPAEFELEALKAQALAARTYIVKQLLEPSEISLPEGAAVTDTTLHQVYNSREELMDQWGNDFDWKYAKIVKAVEETRGRILTFDGQTITAAFFSTSNGYTENAEDYWQNESPYLKSVSSPWDKASPKFTDSQEIPVSVIEETLGVTLPSDGSVGEILERTESNRVSLVEIGGKRFSGRDIRERLDLNSSDFSWERKGDVVVFHTKGFGHGVGMSQYGANGMAMEGKDAEEIVRYYYQGIDISNVSPFVAKLTAKQ